MVPYAVMEQRAATVATAMSIGNQSYGRLVESNLVGETVQYAVMEQRAPVVATARSIGNQRHSRLVELNLVGEAVRCVVLGQRAPVVATDMNGGGRDFQLAITASNCGQSQKELSYDEGLVGNREKPV
jgi:nitrous oxidase accessory protein NosD